MIPRLELGNGPAAPRLYATRAGNTVTAFWQNVSGWTLQQDNRLSQSTNWSASIGMTTSQSMNSLTVTAPTGGLFFRLAKQ